MHGNYSDEKQEGPAYKEKGEYEDPVIDEVGQAKKIFDETVEDIRRMRAFRFKQA